MSTSNTTIYINAAQNVESQSEDVYVKDIGSLACSDEHVLAKVKAIKLHHFKEGEPKRQVISLLKVIQENAERLANQIYRPADLTSAQVRLMKYVRSREGRMEIGRAHV